MLQAATERTIRELSRRSREKMPRYFYHYTSAEGLMGILRNQEVWLGDVRFMNDPSELAFGGQIARETVSSIPDRPGKQAATEVINLALDYLSSNNPSKPLVFALSLSKSGDGLEQWRQYANQGRGYCITINSQSLLNLSLDAFGPFRIRYNKSDQQEAFLLLYDLYCADIESSGCQDVSGFVVQAALGISLLSSMMKNRSYETEGEWRVIAAANPERPGAVKFMARAATIKPYVVRNFRELFGNVEQPLSISIPAITVGPALEPVTLEALGLFMRSIAATDVRVMHSSVPLRAVL